MTARRLISDPLVHFLVLGAALFALYGAVSPDELEESDTNNISITAEDLALMRDDWQKQYRRPPTSAETERLIAERVREEILYREALEMGLDQGDPAIRRQMAEKILFMFQDLATDEEPTAQELQEYLAANADKYALPATVSFRHAFFDTATRENADTDATSAMAEAPRDGAMPVGDAFEFGMGFNRVSEAELSRLLGAGFARAMLDVQGDGWTGPIQSDYGVHLVQVTDFQPARAAELAMMRDKVAADYALNQREAAAERYYAEAKQRYSIDVADTSPVKIASE